MNEILAALHWLINERPLFAFYSEELRDGLFAGFLTVATFLFSVKTFLLVTLEKDVYRDKRYQEFHRQAVREGLASGSHLAPLRRLADRLFLSTILAFSAAVSQITIGLIPANLAAIVAITLCFVSVFDLGRILTIQRRVLQDWLKSIEEGSAEQEKAMKSGDSRNTSASDSAAPGSH